MRDKIVFTTGTFDLIHPGHVWFLRKAKSFGDFLVVAVSPDKLGPKYKRERIMNQKHRVFMVESLNCVDMVIKEKDLDPPENIRELLKVIEPNVFVSGEDNPFKEQYISLCRELKIDYVEIPRNNDGIFDISTTKLLEKIKNV